MKKNAKPSLGDIARVANVSTAAVCYALKNQSGVSRATRERILDIARNLDYIPDARIASWMSRMREAKTKHLLPIAWLNCQPSGDAWKRLKYLSPYLEGARARAMDLGYKLEEIWARQPGMSIRRVAQILEHRGVEGVVVSQPASHLRLNWERMAGVSIDGALVSPNLNRVMSDNAYNLQLALKHLKRLGHTRIGVCLPEHLDSFSHQCRFTAFYFHTMAPKSERVLPLFYSDEETLRDQVRDWLRDYKPKVVVGFDNRLVEWIREAAYHVPEEVGVVHLALDDDASDWAGIYSNKREIGATAVEQLIASMQNRQFGLPSVPSTTLIRGSWRSGCTLQEASPIVART